VIQLPGNWRASTGIKKNAHKFTQLSTIRNTIPAQKSLSVFEILPTIRNLRKSAGARSGQDPNRAFWQFMALFIPELPWEVFLHHPTNELYGEACRSQPMLGLSAMSVTHCLSSFSAFA
jgi:hypothetical protein